LFSGPHPMKRLLFLLALITVFSCGDSVTYKYRLPEIVDDGWNVSTLQEAGLDTVLIESLISNVQYGEFRNIDALLIVRSGKLVLEEYFNGYDRNSKHKLFSCTKSVTSALVCVAIEKGLIKSEHDSLVNYLGHYANMRNPHIDKISIKNVLEMSTGFEWTGDLSESGRKLPMANDMVEYALKLPIESEPGTTFQYSSANTMLLAPVIFNAAGKQAADFAQENLFNKLGITNFDWNRQSEFWTKTVVGLPDVPESPNLKYDKAYAELTNTATGLWMTPRDMGKLGQLYLDNGVWKGEQIIPSAWIEESTTEQIQGSDYGLGWKLMQLDGLKTFYASGYGLQRIFVIPEMNMVIVFTQSWYEDQPKGDKQMMKILKDYILKSIEE
jgi:CubicO group peptidase (beta-lactamase class C family)